MKIAVLSLVAVASGLISNADYEVAHHKVKNGIIQAHKNLQSYQEIPKILSEKSQFWCDPYPTVCGQSRQAFEKYIQSLLNKTNAVAVAASEVEDLIQSGNNASVRIQTILVSENRCTMPRTILLKWELDEETIFNANPQTKALSLMYDQNNFNRVVQECTGNRPLPINTQRFVLEEVIMNVEQKFNNKDLWQRLKSQLIGPNTKVQINDRRYNSREASRLFDIIDEKFTTSSQLSLVPRSVPYPAGHAVAMEYTMNLQTARPQQPCAITAHIAVLYEIQPNSFNAYPLEEIRILVDNEQNLREKIQQCIQQPRGYGYW